MRVLPFQFLMHKTCLRALRERNTHKLTTPCVPCFFRYARAVYKAGLRLVEHKFDLVRCPFRDAYIAKKGDPIQHAKVSAGV